MDDPLLRLANDVRLTVQQLSRRVRFEGSSELAPHQFSVLAKLWHEPRTPGDLAELERVTPPSMTRTVAGLVDGGLIERIPHPGDGRQRLLTLTEDGRAVVQRIMRDRDDWMLKRLETLSVVERRELARAIEILKKVLA